MTKDINVSRNDELVLFIKNNSPVHSSVIYQNFPELSSAVFSQILKRTGEIQRIGGRYYAHTSCLESKDKAESIGIHTGRGDMRTLDEVIKAYEYTYENDPIAWTYGVDALHYLKKYRDNLEARNDQVERYQKAAKDCEEILTDYVALKQYWAEQQENPSLTWDELRQMEGKPVWVVADGKERWRIIREVSSEHLILESGLPLHRCWLNHPDGWQAYRKERK